MANLQQMSRVLHNHVWEDVRQWVNALQDLADLSDIEIAGLAKGERPQAAAETESRELRALELHEATS